MKDFISEPYILTRQGDLSARFGHMLNIIFVQTISGGKKVSINQPIINTWF